jgi:hypothetical protein
MVDLGLNAGELLFVNIFFALCSLLALLGMFYSEKASEISARYFEWTARMYGFEATVKSTGKAVQLTQIWNGVFFVIFLLLVIIPK